MLLILALFPSGLLAAPIQDAREVQIVSENLIANPSGISIASENGDTAAVVYEDTGDSSIWIATSDGRGISWRSPIRLDDDATGSPKNSSESSLLVDENRIYVAWKDRRNGLNDDLYFTASEDGGLTWLPSNVRLKDGFGKGDNDLKDFRLGSGGKDVIALCSTNDGEEKLFLTYSNDSGSSWSSAIDVTSHNGQCDVDNVDMACEDDIAYIVWRDNFLNGVDDTIWLSIFNFKNGNFIAQDINVSPNLISLGGDADDGVSVAVDDNYLAIMYHADNLGGSAEQVRINLSSNLGQSFLGDAQVGEYDNSGLNHDADGGCIAVEDGTVAVAWRDNRTGGNELYSAIADIESGVFSPDHLCSDGSPDISTPRIAGEFSGEPLAISWSSGSPKVYKSCYYINDVWADSFVVSENPSTVTNARIAWNDTYKNFLAAYTSDFQGTPQVWVSGYRSQQIDPGSPVAGASASFQLSGFDSRRSYQVVAALNSGNLVLPDGRNLGISYDNYTDITRNLPALSGGFDAAGRAVTSGVTTPSSLSGVSMYLVAVALDGPLIKAFSDATIVQFQ